MTRDLVARNAVVKDAVARYARNDHVEMLGVTRDAMTKDAVTRND